MMDGDSTNSSVEPEPVLDGSSVDNRVDSASVHSIDASTAVEGSIDSVSAEGNVSDVNSRGAGDSNNEASSDRSHGSVNHVKSEQKQVQRRKESKSKQSTSPVYDSVISMFDQFAANGSVATDGRSPTSGHGFEVGDMVWGKVKSHPWWPGHIFSEKFATPSVRRSKRDGLLLVAFFGDSSYGWFDPSELMPFDSNFAEKSRQTNSKTFVKAVEEAMDEVSRRSSLGLSCMCRSKRNFRQTDVQGYFAVDVTDYEPGAVYSIDAIEKARDGFQPSSALDFVRRLALEPTGSEHGGVDFIKNKAKVISYRRAVYEEFDETYAQAFGYDSVRPLTGSNEEPEPRKTPSKAPLSGRQVFADTSGKGKSSAKPPSKPKDLAKKDKYLFKRRDESKEVKTDQKREENKVKPSSQLVHIEDDMAVHSGDFVLQKRVSATTHEELPSKDSGAKMEDMLLLVESGNPGLQTIKNKVVDDNNDDKMIVSQMEDKKTSSDLVVDKSSNDKRALTQNDIPSSGPHKTVASENTDNGPKKVKKVSKRPAGELGSHEKKKRKKEQSISDGTAKVSFVDKQKVSVKKAFQSSIPPIEDPHGPVKKSLTSHTSGTKDATGLASNETEFPLVLGDLVSLALDPFHAMNRSRLVKTRQVFLKFRSLVFQKSLNLSPAAEDDSENGTGVTPVKSQSTSSEKPNDPTIAGRKRGPSDRQEEMAARKKKKVGEIRNLKEKKMIKKIDEGPTPIVKQPVVKTLKKSGPQLVKKTEQGAPPNPTMLMIKFPQGGSLPSTNELKARFARFGPMDHSATRIYWNKFTCRVVYRHMDHAQAAQRFVVGTSSLFGNTDVKCTLKEVGVDLEPPPPVKVPKEDHLLGMEPMVPAASGVQLKSILKKSGGEEAAGNGSKARVKFMLGGEENQLKNNMEKKNDASSFSKSHSPMDINSKNFQKAVLQSSSSNPLPPLLPFPTSVFSSTTQFTKPPPNSMHYATPLAPPPRLPPPPSLNLAAKTPLPVTQKVDISNQMLSLLTKCNEVVTNVTNMFGYVPYRPL